MDKEKPTTCCSTIESPTLAANPHALPTACSLLGLGGGAGAEFEYNAGSFAGLGKQCGGFSLPSFCGGSI